MWGNILHLPSVVHCKDEHANPSQSNCHDKTFPKPFLDMQTILDSAHAMHHLWTVQVLLQSPSSQILPGPDTFYWSNPDTPTSFFQVCVGSNSLRKPMTQNAFHTGQRRWQQKEPTIKWCLFESFSSLTPKYMVDICRDKAYMKISLRHFLSLVPFQL